jgi:hypothetical protein
MKQVITFVLFTFFLSGVHAQVGIGTTTPDASAALEVSSSDKGFLMPRMTTAQREAIASPSEALKVYDTDTQSFWAYIDGAWAESKPGAGKFVDGAAEDIAFYDGRVGIGRNAFSSIHRLYVENVNDAERNTSAVIRGVYNGTGNAISVYGSGSVSRNEGTGTVGFAIGNQGIVQNTSQSTMTNAVGSYPQIENFGTINFASGQFVDNLNRSGGSIATSRGMDVALTNESGATLGTGSLASMFATNDGAITGDGYGLFIGGSGSGSVGGDSYALYLSTPFSNVAGTSYALYSDNTGDSYMEGNLGVGTSSPQQKVHINGVMRLEPQATPPTGALGDLYVSTGGELFFHNGTGWQQVQLVP